MNSTYKDAYIKKEGLKYNFIQVNLQIKLSKWPQICLLDRKRAELTGLFTEMITYPWKYVNARLEKCLKKYVMSQLIMD